MCIVLSGTRRDGAAGVEAIKTHGGLALVQDPETAEHDGMPRSAIATGMVDLVAPVEELPAALQRYVQHPQPAEPGADDPGINAVISVLRTRADFDVRQYKRSTVQRRIRRRMGLRRTDQVADYLELLRRDVEESKRLVQGPVHQRHRVLPRARCVDVRRREVIAPLVAARAETSRCACGCRAAPPARKPTRWPCCSSRPPLP